MIKEGGNLGYDIRPSFRRNGMATLMFGLLLEKLKYEQVKSVLITCDEDNIASNRVVLKHGGLLESSIVSNKSGKPVNCYCIDLDNYIPREFWDVYDSKGNKLLKKAIRGDNLNPGEFHLVVSLWIKNSSGQILVSVRSFNKSGACKKEIPGGAATMGDSSIIAVIREVKEELGLYIHKEDLTFIHRIVDPQNDASSLFDIWITEKEIGIKDLILQKEEVESAQWMEEEDVFGLIKRGDFFGSRIHKQIIDRL